MTMTSPVVLSDPDVLGSTPAFAGTRVAVCTLLDDLAAGDSLGEFLEDFPRVRRELAIATARGCSMRILLALLLLAAVLVASRAEVNRLPRAGKGQPGLEAESECCRAGNGSARAAAGGNQPPRRFDALWNDLASMDAAHAYDALCLLVQEGGRAVAFLGGRIEPAPKADPGRMERLVRELDSDQFRVREKAIAELKTFGESARPALRNVLKSKPSLELRIRVKLLLQRLEGPVLPADQLRVLRAIEAIERIGTPEARVLLRKLSEGAAECRQTQEAKASLDRLTGDKR